MSFSVHLFFFLFSYMSVRKELSSNDVHLLINQLVNQLVTRSSMDVAFGVSVVLATFLDHAVVESAFSAANAASC